ncbi:sce7725 family protein [Pedobacter namyangjuensis]|uniref:sce7725 family protein n=1 Tax=Pedobacter namyangjuensis TaxID=600626 RepID=UPI000DE547E9|nr:sce7725 family protein [Pedobacter namyangjuensis]
MYLPYLRGKQFELLALRELTALPLDPNKISPIIEPLKKELKSIETAIRALSAQKIQVQLVVNPEHGDLKKNYKPILDFISRLLDEGIDNIIPTYLIANEQDFQFFKSSSLQENYLSNGYSLIHLNQISSGAELKQIANNSNLQYNLIHVSHLIAMRRGFSTGLLGFVNDSFIKQKRNVDYENSVDEIFSSDYFYYRSEGFDAFADYVTVGAEYVEGGMLPFAVVIHLTYKDYNSDDIRIQHFLSDNNLDASDTAGKFGEALGKLIAFVDAEGINSLAVRQFRDYYARGAFPGLGVIKKLSIMHHIELVQSLLP